MTGSNSGNAQYFEHDQMRKYLKIDPNKIIFNLLIVKYVCRFSVQVKHFMCKVVMTIFDLNNGFCVITATNNDVLLFLRKLYFAKHLILKTCFTMPIVWA